MKLGTIGVARCPCGKSFVGDAYWFACSCGQRTKVAFYVPIERLAGLSDAVNAAMLQYCSPDSPRENAADIVKNESALAAGKKEKATP